MSTPDETKKFVDTIREAVGIELDYEPELQRMLDTPQRVTNCSGV